MIISLAIYRFRIGPWTNLFLFFQVLAYSRALAIFFKKKLSKLFIHFGDLRAKQFFGHGADSVLLLYYQSFRLSHLEILIL